jgi:S-adenosylmethionine:diacylglycerol 3-amino-3-carboxypropyl transferase
MATLRNLDPGRTLSGAVPLDLPAQFTNAVRSDCVTRLADPGQDGHALSPSGTASILARLRDRFVYRPLAFAEPAESIELAQCAMAVTPGDVITGITSSGDVLLSLLAGDPALVIGFDANPTQTAVGKLKRVLCARTPLEVALRFLGLASESSEKRLETWAELRPHLGANASFLEKYDLGKGVLNCGTTRKLFRLMSLGLRICVGTKGYARLMDPRSTCAERLEVYEALRRRAEYRFLVRPMLHWGSRCFQHFFYPPALCVNSGNPRRALQDIVSTFQRLFEVGFHDNPVFGRYLTGEIPPEQIRQLYSEPAWKVLREKIDRIKFETRTIQDGIRELAPRSVDAFYLSNAPDYLRPDELRSLCEAMARAARAGARVYYLSLDPVCPFARIGLHPAFTRVPDLERTLKQMDPVGLYQYLGVLIRE